MSFSFFRSFERDGRKSLQHVKPPSISPISMYPWGYLVEIEIYYILFEKDHQASSLQHCAYEHRHSRDLLYHVAAEREAWLYSFTYLSLESKGIGHSGRWHFWKSGCSHQLRIVVVFFCLFFGDSVSIKVFVCFCRHLRWCRFQPSTVVIFGRIWEGQSTPPQPTTGKGGWAMNSLMVNHLWSGSGRTRQKLRYTDDWWLENIHMIYMHIMRRRGIP